MDTTTLNGRPPRKSLSSQLDRLDQILEALEDGLQETVSQVIREAVTLAVRQAVEQTIREVLANPELLRSLASQGTPISQPVAAAPATQIEPKSSKLKNALALGWLSLRHRTKCAGLWLTKKARELPGNIRDGWRWVRAAETMQGVREVTRKAWELRRPVALSLAVGLVTGVAGYLMGPVIAAVALGGCGATMSLTAMLAAPFVRMWKGLASSRT